MERICSLTLAALFFSSALFSQTSDLVFFSDDGSRFTLIIDGEVKNDAPAARVVATAIRNETPVVMVRFEDASIPQMRRSLYYPAGMEYTTMITTNKKGERVFRPSGEAALGTAAKSTPPPTPVDFVDDAPAPTAVPAQQQTVSQTTGVGGVQQTTTVVVTEDAGTGTGDGVRMNMGINGLGINMDVRVNDGTTNTTGRTTTTTTTTTTTSTTVGGVSQTVTMDVSDPFLVDPVEEPSQTRPAGHPVVEPYRMPGYTGPIGCAMPMSQQEFADARKSIEGKSFEDSRMTTAKQMGRDRCFTSDQVKGIMGLFSFEDSRLEFAKYAYERTHDIGNYFKVNDAFTFESSIDDLNQYIQSR